MPGVPLMYIVSRRYQIERLPDGGVRYSPFLLSAFQSAFLGRVIKGHVSDLVGFLDEQAPA